MIQGRGWDYSREEGGLGRSFQPDSLEEEVWNDFP